MIITGFLGFLTIAPNDSNSSTKQQYLKANKFTKQQYIKVNKFTKSGYVGKRSFSTSRRVNSTTNPKGLSQVQVFI